MTTPEQYKAYIVDMLDGISDEKRLKQIFTIVHRFFINERVKKCKEDATERRLELHIQRMEWNHERKDKDIVQYG